MRYADDSICMCRTPKELQKAEEVVHRVMAELGLELAEDKTKAVDFHKDDFDFLGFTFCHLRTSARGREYYVVQPSEKSLKKFRDDIKALTSKQCTFSFEEWCRRLNPVLRGKFNYFLIANMACRDVWQECQKRGRNFKGIAYKEYSRLDGYVRERLRTAFKQWTSIKTTSTFWDSRSAICERLPEDGSITWYNHQKSHSRSSEMISKH